MVRLGLIGVDQNQMLSQWPIGMSGHCSLTTSCRLPIRLEWVAVNGSPPLRKIPGLKNLRQVC
jgi:hypothetical protein